MSFWKRRKIRKYGKLVYHTAAKLYRRNRTKLKPETNETIGQDLDLLKEALKERNTDKIEIATMKVEQDVDTHLAFARKSVVREYAEAFLFALILAMILRTFIIQLFKIPTGSMEPTLYGAQGMGKGFGDHVVVNKFIYGPKTLDWIGIPWTDYGIELPSWRLDFLAVRKPARGDVIVFKFPFNYTCPFCGDINVLPDSPRVCPRCGSKDIDYQNKDYIKRCIGLPGDTVEIRNGDIFINGEIVTEPEIVKEIHYENIPPARGKYGHRGQRFTVPENSYFVLGDNSRSSKDSRYWGFVPFENIRGEAFFVYLPPSRIGLIP